jgi:hypothetical protein
VETPTPPQPDDDGEEDDGVVDDGEEDDGEEMLKFHAGMQANGFVYWKNMTRAFLLVLNTATLQFSRVDLPSILGAVDYKLFSLGHTKDGRLCMVAADDSDAYGGTLLIWFLIADHDGIEKWMLQETYPLTAFLDAKSLTEDHPMLEIEGVIDGFVYLSIKYDVHTRSLLSLCLETGKLNKIFDDTFATPAHPYVMAWPPSLVYNKASPCLKISV